MVILFCRTKEGKTLRCKRGVETGCISLVYFLIVNQSIHLGVLNWICEHWRECVGSRPKHVPSACMCVQPGVRVAMCCCCRHPVKDDTGPSHTADSDS